MKNVEQRCLGTIRLDGQPLVVVDPCYIGKGTAASPDDPDGTGEVDSGLSGHAIIEGVPAGEYPVWVEISDERAYGKRVAELRLEVRPGAHGLRREPGELGVDSGQMCMVPLSALPGWGGQTTSDEFTAATKDAPEGSHPFAWLAAKHHAEGKFDYEAACHLTLGEEGDGHGGVLNGLMAVCSSGYGDGAYPLYISRDSDGTVTAVTVAFLEDDDEGDL